MVVPVFSIGQLVQHCKFGYRGVVVDIDLEFGLSSQWYEQVARSRPPRDRPWYRVLVHDSDQVTYVAERHLEEDDAGGQVHHPQIEEYFDAFSGEFYVRGRDVN